MYNKIAKILIIAILLMTVISPSFSVTVNVEPTAQTTTSKIEQSDNNEQASVKSVPTDNNLVTSESTITEQVQADVDNSIRIPPKSEIKHVFSKFFKTMLLVLGSCIIIYLLLLGYKRLKTPKTLKISNIDVQKNLNSPETIEEATKLFIEKF